MNLIRLLLVLSLMPVMAFGGMPQVACRCSNGALLLHCCKLVQSKRATANGPSCCESRQNAAPKCCSRASEKTGTKQVICCDSGCTCTPVWITADVGPVLGKVRAPEPAQFDLSVVSIAPREDSRQALVISKTIDTGPLVAIDFVLAYERFLI